MTCKSQAVLFCGVFFFPMPLVLGSIAKGVFGQKMSHCRLLRGEGMKLWGSGADYAKLKIPL